MDTQLAMTQTFHNELGAEHHDFLSSFGTFTSEAGGEKLVGYRCTYRLAAYRDSLFDHFGITFPSQLSNAVSKRRSEYLAGRLCAWRTLMQLGIPESQCDIASRANREPIWPPGVVASISHTKELAVCLATARAGVLGLGIDIEREMQPEVAENVGYQIVDANEEQLIRDFFQPYQQGLTVVFSAKESIYKALYRHVGRFFGFSAVKLVRWGAGRLGFLVAEPLSAQIRVDYEIAVDYKIADGEILTIAYVPRDETASE